MHPVLDFRRRKEPRRRDHIGVAQPHVLIARGQLGRQGAPQPSLEAGHERDGRHIVREEVRCVADLVKRWARRPRNSIKIVEQGSEASRSTVVREQLKDEAHSGEVIA